MVDIHRAIGQLFLLHLQGKLFMGKYKLAIIRVQQIFEIAVVTRKPQRSVFDKIFQGFYTKLLNCSLLNHCCQLTFITVKVYCFRDLSTNRIVLECFMFDLLKEHCKHMHSIKALQNF